jgi:hypothetical protein
MSKSEGRDDGGQPGVKRKVMCGRLGHAHTAVYEEARNTDNLRVGVVMYLGRLHDRRCKEALCLARDI